MWNRLCYPWLDLSGNWCNNISSSFYLRRVWFWLATILSNSQELEDALQSLNQEGKRWETELTQLRRWRRKVRGQWSDMSFCYFTVRYFYVLKKACISAVYCRALQALGMSLFFPEIFSFFLLLFPLLFHWVFTSEPVIWYWFWILRFRSRLPKVEDDAVLRVRKSQLLTDD